MLKFADIFYSGRTVIRFSAASALLLLAVITHSMLLSLLLLLFAALLIRMLDDSWKKLVYMLQLLRWFITPILILHLFFSHGQLVFPATLLPFTWQGLHQGIWLSVHLSTVFIVAMVMFRALRGSEWMRLIRSLPLVGERVAVYMLMLGPMRTQITRALQQLNMQWRLRRSWRDFPQLVLAAFCFSLSGTVVYAQALWLRWPASVESNLFSVAGSVPERDRLLMNLGCLAVLLSACGLMFE